MSVPWVESPAFLLLLVWVYAVVAMLDLVTEEESVRAGLDGMHGPSEPNTNERRVQ